MEQGSVLRIVVASPGDVQEERELLSQVVTELNENLAASEGIFLYLARWETDSYPGFHPLGPQGLIDQNLKIEECDLLIGIFWKRFGTPVADAESGTAHELGKAYKAWKTQGRPQIMVYFNQAPYSPESREETEQWGKVLDYKKSFPKEGLWWPYRGKAELEKLVRGHLTKYLMNLAKARSVAEDPDRAIDRRTELVRANPDRAEAEYRDAVRLNPESAEAHNNLGMALYFKGDLDGATAELREAIRLNRQISYQHNNLGCVLTAQGNLEGAEAEFREAFRVDPSHAKAHANLGDILLNRADRKAALEQYRIASRLRPSNGPWRAAYEGLKAELESAGIEESPSSISLTTRSVAFSRDKHGFVIEVDLQNPTRTKLQVTNWTLEIRSSGVTLAGGPGPYSVPPPERWCPYPPFVVSANEMIRGLVFFRAGPARRQRPPIEPVSATLTAHILTHDRWSESLKSIAPTD